MELEETARTLGALGTCIGVAVAAIQLYLNRRQLKANLEDDLSREYRAISQQLPADAFFKSASRAAPLT